MKVVWPVGNAWSVSLKRAPSFSNSADGSKLKGRCVRRPMVFMSPRILAHPFVDESRKRRQETADRLRIRKAPLGTRPAWSYFDRVTTPCVHQLEADFVRKIVTHEDRNP